MKNIFTRLQKLYYRIKYYRKHKKFDGIDASLQKALQDREIERIILKHQITKYMRKYLKIGAQSKYIPKDNKSREQSRQQVIGRFGTEMDALGIYITYNLKLCTL